jgi:ubiquinone/menaquinone biosynthesis C-methylase UbiE
MLTGVLAKNWLIHHLWNREVVKAAKAHARGSLIDIGCGDKPYYSEISPFVSSYIGLDHTQTLYQRSMTDVLGSAYEIPVEDNHFDTVLCTEVAEHLEEPTKAIAEARRVLKAGGYAIYSVPLFWHLHDKPRDFYRYTKYALRYLFEKNGFEIAGLKCIGGFWVTFGQEFVYYLWSVRRGGALNPLWWLIPIIGTLVQGICYLLGKIDHSEDFTTGYLVIARKR